MQNSVLLYSQKKGKTQKEKRKMKKQILYDYIANNYYQLSKEELKDYILEALWQIQERTLKYDEACEEIIKAVNEIHGEKKRGKKQ